MRYDVIVVGGGAAGLFCAFTAARRGRKVLVIEHNRDVGEKIRISGGGRCNFTNTNATPGSYISASPSFCKSALARYPPEDFIALVESHGIAYHEKKLGQLFCDASSRGILAMLLGECARASVEIRCGTRITEIAEGFCVRTDSADLRCGSLVIATGGLSFPKLGASDFGHRVARQFGLRVTATKPGLVPLRLAPDALRDFSPLSGLSLPVEARLGGTSFSDSLLFTHRGLSGPATLQISSFWSPGDSPSFDLLPGLSLPQAARSPSAASLFSDLWPRRFVEVWSARHCPAAPPARWSAREWQSVTAAAHNWSPPIAGTEGFPKAEVTLGGVDTRDLSSQTMAARLIPGLYFIGEVVDVTGWLGGYNFHWAWASAHAAGSSI